MPSLNQRIRDLENIIIPYELVVMLYFVEELTVVEISRYLKLSRPTIYKLISEASTDKYKKIQDMLRHLKRYGTEEKPHKSREYLPIWLKLKVLEEGGYKCKICDTTDNLSVRPADTDKKTRKNNFKNLHIICKRCSGKKEGISEIKEIDKVVAK